MAQLTPKSIASGQAGSVGIHVSPDEAAAADHPVLALTAWRNVRNGVVMLQSNDLQGNQAPTITWRTNDGNHQVVLDLENGTARASTFKDNHGSKLAIIENAPAEPGGVAPVSGAHVNGIMQGLWSHARRTGDGDLAATLDTFQGGLEAGRAASAAETRRWMEKWGGPVAAALAPDAQITPQFEPNVRSGGFEL